MSSFEFNKNRLLVVYLCIIIGFLLVTSRLLYIVIFSEKIDVGKIYNSNKITKRADIVDRNGIIVASDLDVKFLYANATLIRNPKYVAKELSDNFEDLSYKRLLQRLSRAKDGWILIKRNITPKQEQLINNLGIAGLVFEDGKTRVYPQKSVFSHIIGYTDLDGNGISGIEKQYDEYLKSNTQNLQLAMDVRVQDILNFELRSAIKEYNAFSAFGIVLDITSGEVIALSSLPSFDVNNQSSASDKEKFNRATYGVYELGSVFKIFNHALAIESKTAKLSDPYVVRDQIKYDQFTIDDDHKDKDILTVAEIFIESSNIGSVKLAQNFGPEKQQEFMQKLGLLDKVTVDFPSLGTPIYPKRWGKTSLATISFGHGIAVTPLHIASAAGGIINDGDLATVSFLKLNGKPTFKNVISKSTSDIMKQLLRDTVIKGTGKKANIAGYEVGGKTGTAERAEGGSYNKNKTLASFLASFPMSNPKYVVFVGIDRPNVQFNTGGMVGAPVAGEIIRNIAPILH